MFAASLQLTLDYDALIETDSHNDDQQEDKNDYREDDGTTFYRDRPRSRKAADEGKMQGAMTACGRLCCKSILSILSRNIDSRSGANAQQRFKGARAPIRSLQISISQRLLGDFCNTIGTFRTSQDVRLESAKWGKADLDQVAVTNRNFMSTP
jgi:hypothetical protein